MNVLIVCIVLAGVVQFPVVKCKKQGKICYDSMDAMMSQMFWKGLCSFQTERKNCKRHKATGGTTYIQWGRSTCTQKHAELVYSGYVGGNDYNIKGAAVNKLCLPKEPQWGIHDNKVNKNPSVGGTVFDIYDINIPNTLFDQKYHLYRIECSVCHIKHGSTTIMIPGRKECFGDWKMEYSGYLFAGHPTHQAASEYLCMDGKPDHLQKTSSSWTKKAVLYPVHASCNNALQCPPYKDGREMTCVVCSK